MGHPDFNLLVTLDVLLAERSVTRAARKLRLSPSAMSRALARLRETVGDPLLVRAGRALVPTPRAIELQDQVRVLVQDAEAVLKPAKLPELPKLKRTFTIRASDGFAESFGPALIDRVRQAAPGVTLRLTRKLDRDSTGLREGSVDLETGVIGRTTSPELRSVQLFRDQFLGVVRYGHPLLEEDVTLPRYGEQAHVAVGRRGGPGHVEEALKASGVARQVSVEVDGYSAACALVRSSDLVATLPEEHTRGLREGLTSFVLPFPAPGITISLLWHPRMDGDPAHAWLRQCIKEICSTASSPTRSEGPT